MKQLIFKRVRYKNIMSVGNQHVDINLNTHKKTLCTGKNGAGKSTTLEAIYFGLSGKPFRDIKKDLLINSVNKKGLEVELWLEYDGDEFHIFRGMKPNKLKISRNGTEIEAVAAVKDFQEYFETLIGMNAASFKQVVVLGTAGYVPFMQLSTAARRKLVEDLLEVSVLGDMDKLNKARLREIAQEISVHEMKISHLEQQKQTHVDHQAKQNQNSAENIERYNSMRQEYLDKASVLKTEIDALHQLVLETTTTSVDPTERLQKFQQALYTLQSKHQQFSSVKNMHSKGGSCPTCMQQFDDANLLSKIGDNITDIETKLQKVNDEVNRLKTEQQEYQSRLAKLRDINQQIQFKRTQVAECNAKAEQVEAIIGKLKQEHTDYSEQILALTQQINVAIESKSNLLMEKYHRSQITEMLKDSGIKASIIKKYIPFFNQRIAHYLTIMEADYIFTLNEEFSEKILSHGREAFVYNSFSQGEKARIDLAMLFTWRDVAAKISGVHVNALFLDECFDGPADSDCTGSLHEILNTLNSNIYIISHSDQDLQNYDRQIRMEKKGRFSQCSIT